MSESIKEVHSLCIRKNLPFATFRLPHQTNVTTYIQTSSRTHEWNSLNDFSVQKGFVMAPFDTRNGKKYIFIHPDLVIDESHPAEKSLRELSLLPDNQLKWESSAPVVTEKDEYVDQVDHIKTLISNGFFQKSVLSRIKKIEGDFSGDISSIFEEMCKRHPNAFVYVFKSDDTFWAGASPEPLLRLAEKKISTVSLAGTRTFSDENMDLDDWSMKEVLEQEYVTRYIHDILREFEIKEYRNSSPYVKKAGDLVHLRTDFTFNYSMLEDRIWDFLDAMHPTPAVAGQPKKEAITFIKRFEPHDREYYTGFLGPIQALENIDIFVNLRCMKITPDHLSLYVGGGITLESVPEDEWEETQLKAKSLLNIIELISKSKDDKNAI
jgi:isochorismate synthase